MDRTIHLKDKHAYVMALNLINNLPMQGGLDLIIRPHKEQRSPSQNKLMWASANADIAQQAWMNGRQYSAVIWHEYLKQMFMPETHAEDVSILVKNIDTYVKWAETPDGKLRCVASTTSLTKKGFSDYIEQVYSLGAELGVMFTAVQR